MNHRSMQCPNPSAWNFPRNARNARVAATWGVLVAVVASFALISPAAHAQDLSSAEQDDVQKKLAEMQEALNRVLNENQTMRAEMDELKASTEDNWLTEQRSQEIRQIVSDVLADTDTRATLLENGMTGGWHEHFFLASPDGRFKFILEGTIQARYVYNYTSSAGDNHRSGFENTRTTLTMRGHVFDQSIQYLVRSDFTRNEPGLVNGLNFLRDAWVRKQLSETWSIRGGQFKLPFNREELMPATRQLAVERSLVNESLNIGRSQGIEFAYHDGPHKVNFVISDGGADELAGFPGLIAGGTVLGTTGSPPPSGFTNPTNTEALVEDVEWAFTARYEQLITGSWIQFADFTSPVDESFAAMWGVAVHMQDGEGNSGRSTGRERRLWMAYTADLSIEWGGANLYSAFTHHYVDNRRAAFGFFNFFGAVVQGGVYITPKWELFARGEWGHVRTDVTSDQQDLWAATIGANYYMDGHDAKFTADLGISINEVDRFWNSDIAGWRTESSGTAPQFVFRTQFQLLF